MRGQWDVLHQREDYCWQALETNSYPDWVTPAFDGATGNTLATVGTDGRLLLYLANGATNLDPILLTWQLAGGLDPTAVVRRIVFHWSAFGVGSNCIWSLDRYDGWTGAYVSPWRRGAAR